MPEFVLDETVRTPGDPRGVQILAIDLVAVDGPSRGARVRVKGGGARVGSAPGNDLVLADRSVSRAHCELTVSASSIALRDLGSTNGTFAADVRVRDADVTVGTVVRCGGSSFRIESTGEPSFVAISERTSFGELVGDSLAMRQVYAVLERVAASDSTLLVRGETGTGKDVAARSVHATSARRGGPFVPVDCGAIPETLFESELFGHVRGAFTGAVQSRAGAFEEAAGGTLFLDEIGEMPLALQAKLLRAIESRRIRRVGASKETDVDVRLVCATNRDLARMVNEGSFREDLYYRLAVVEVTLPPLRARREDIPALARHLHETLARAGGREQPEPLARAFVDALAERAWPGNVRELRNAIERAVTLGHATHGAAEDGSSSGSSSDADTSARTARRAAPAVLPPGMDVIVPLHLPLKEARLAWTSEFEDVYVRAMLAKTGGNVTKAAELAGVSRRFLQRTLARLGIRAADDASIDGDD